MLVHLGWTGSPPPDRILQAVESARKVAAGCDVVFHDDESMVPLKWRAAMDRMSLPPHMRSDVQRHAILEAYGGLWVDADVRLLADPATWSAGWDRYTAVLMTDGGFIGTDIIYVPHGWDGWHAVNEYVDGFLFHPPQRYGSLHLAGTMIRMLAKQMPDKISVLYPQGVFPFSAGNMTTESVVARGFSPDGVIARRPPMGLGDLVKAGLSAVGITEQRVSKALGRPCGCGKRAAKLNELGTYLGLPPGSTAGG